MELGEQIRARIGAEVLDQMLDDLIEGLVGMARAEQAAHARVASPDADCVQQSDTTEKGREAGKESDQ